MSCAATQKEIRAQVASSEWQIIEKGGYEGGGPLVDFLTGKGMSIRLEADNDWQTKSFFTIRTMFMSFGEEVVYSPEKVTVIIAPEMILTAKPFTCAHTIMDLSLMRSSPPLKSPIYVKRLDCFLLFFDHPALSENQEIVMFMNDAITSNGQTLGVPPVKFKKNPKFKDKSAIKDYFR